MNRSFIIIVFFVVCSFVVRSQDSLLIDSLLNIIKTTESSIGKVGAMNSAAQILLKVDKDDAKEYAQQALEISKGINYKKGEADALRILGRYYRLMQDYEESENKLSEAIQLYKSIDDTSNIAICYLDIGYAAMMQDNYGYAGECIKRSLLLFDEISDKRNIAACYLTAGTNMAYQSDYDSAVVFYKKAIDIYREIENLKGVSDCLNNIGVIYNYQGNHDKSVEYQEKSLSVAREINNKVAIASRLVNLGAAYDDRSEYDKALKCYSEAIEIKRELGDKQGVSTCYNNIGEVHKDLGNYLQAMKNYEASLNIAKEVNDRQGVAICLLNLGEIQSKQKNLQKAIDYYRQANIIADSIKNVKIVAVSLNNIGEAFVGLQMFDSAAVSFEQSIIASSKIDDKSEIARGVRFQGIMEFEKEEYTQALRYFKRALKLHENLGEESNQIIDMVRISETLYFLKQYNKAISYAERAFVKAEEISSKENIRDASEVLSLCYSKIGDYENAYKYSVVFKDTHDKLFTIESQKQINLIEHRFELERKQQEIEIQKVELSKQEVEIKRQYLKQRALVGGIIGSFLIILLIIYNYFRIRRARDIISDQKNRIEITNKSLNNINEELRVTLETVKEQNKVIQSSNRELKSSIRYAKHIQNAILPHKEKFQTLFPDSFILYKPKDIVSGDFYWITQMGSKKIIAAADCTGHGVPGAFMSLLGISFLNEIVNKEMNTEASQIINKLRAEVTESLQQDGKIGEQIDGMDIAVCVFDEQNLELDFAGANMPMYLVRKKESRNIIEAVKSVSSDSHILYEIKGDKMPASFFYKMGDFNTFRVKLEIGDQIYLFSDGFTDQFNSLNRKRYGSARFKKLLLKVSESSVYNQQKILEQEFVSYKDGFEQIDDVMVIGISV